jgi:hypothetical protein
VIVPASDLDSVVDRLMQFHSNMTATDFIERQRMIRAFWVDWLAPESFFRRVVEHWDLLKRSAERGPRHA